jgi:hypothetical protein
LSFGIKTALVCLATVGLLKVLSDGMELKAVSDRAVLVQEIALQFEVQPDKLGPLIDTHNRACIEKAVGSNLPDFQVAHMADTIRERLRLIRTVPQDQQDAEMQKWVDKAVVPVVIRLEGLGAQRRDSVLKSWAALTKDPMPFLLCVVEKIGQDLLKL